MSPTSSISASTAQGRRSGQPGGSEVDRGGAGLLLDPLAEGQARDARSRVDMEVSRLWSSRPEYGTGGGATGDRARMAGVDKPLDCTRRAPARVGAGGRRRLRRAEPRLAEVQDHAKMWRYAKVPLRLGTVTPYSLVGTLHRITAIP